MSYTDKLEWETLRIFDAATLTGSFQAFGAALANPAYILKMVNNSTAAVLISDDGVNAKDVCPAGSFWLYDEGKVGQSGSYPALAKGTQISIKLEGSAGAGSIYLVVQYIIQG